MAVNLFAGALRDAVQRLRALVEAEFGPRGPVSDAVTHHQRCRAVVSMLTAACETATAEEVAAVLPDLGFIIEELPIDLAAEVAVAGGNLVELGADPLPLVEPVFGTLSFILEQCGQFIEQWPQTPGEPPTFPNPHSDIHGNWQHEERDSLATWKARTAEQLTAAMTPAMTAAKKAVAGTGRFPKCPANEDIECGLSSMPCLVCPALMVESWYSADAWMQPAVTLLQDVRVRRALSNRSELLTGVDGVRRWRGDVFFLAILLRVLDDELLIVVHRPTGRAFEFRIGGIVDFHQLHTLLAARLLADPDSHTNSSTGSSTDADAVPTSSSRPDPGVLPGRGPSREQVAAADGSGHKRTRMQRFFDLTDCQGVPLWSDGIPEYIPRTYITSTADHLLERRVVVLDQPSQDQIWADGRMFDRMLPTLTPIRELSGDEAKKWMAVIRDR